MAKNNAYDEGLYLIGFESGDKVSITEDGCRILGVDDEKSNSARKEPEEVFDVIGGISDAFDKGVYVMSAVTVTTRGLSVLPSFQLTK